VKKTCKTGKKGCSKPMRGDFALSGGRFPLNTPGRRKAAPGMAAYSFKKGNITAAQKAQVDRAARRK
jgi:hypothetical protein